LAESPEDPGTVLRVARSENLVGQARQLHGETNEARAHYRHAAEVAKRMLELDPSNAAAGDLLVSIGKKTELVDNRSPGDALRDCPKL
jgi:hypothetical protein